MIDLWFPALKFERLAWLSPLGRLLGSADSLLLLCLTVGLTRALSSEDWFCVLDCIVCSVASGGVTCVEFVLL